ncbi:MAG: thop1 [Verrucomicrobiales bacterium]|nr:thop1 [Verrucomicrobiales bacterium]
MALKLYLALGLVGLAAGCSTPAEKHQASTPPSTPRTLDYYQAKADRFNSILAFPHFELTPGEIKTTLKETIAAADKSLDAIGALKPADVTFKNTVVALDDLSYEATKVSNRFNLIKETSKDASVRDAAIEAIKEFQDWAVGLDYREDVYKAIKAYADKNTKLTGEDAKLLKETLRDYRRAGLELPPAQRKEVEALRKEVSRLATDFETNVTEAKKSIVFTKVELEGLPEDFLTQIKTGDNQYTVMANVTFHYIMVQENAKKEETRKKVEFEHDNLAREKNVPLLGQILKLRHTIANKLGYPTWADFQIEPKMAKTSKEATEFLQNMKTGLQPKFEAEISEFKKLKARDTGNANPSINLWDSKYYANQLLKEKYSVDAEELRAYFPYERVLDGMFKIYQQIFELKIEPIEPPFRWVEDLKMFVVSDSRTGEPMGMFYLDMFPRDGKYNHFAEFGIIEGKLLANGKYQRPTVALICNFPPPSKDKPSLLAHHEVETLFHEFGHALHAILTRAHYSRFAGTSVPGDFVEAPSQMLERWVWDKKVLDSFAAHYQDPTKKIPAATLGKLKESKLATRGNYYRRQLSFGLTDLVLHSGYKEGEDVVKISNDTTFSTFLPGPENTAYVAYFGHLMGYDAGYYGYAWADAIAADMATVFENSPGGYYDAKVGRRLRDEIYAPGSSREVEESIRKFLGRERSIKPFLKSIGIDETTSK